eukprot:jgi/Botrbrau1/17412/Bobra.0054s0008.1
MKIRIRIQDGSTLKFEIGSSETVGDLQGRLAEVLGKSFGPEFNLSLNRKVPLEGDAATSLSAAGVTSGDLLYLLRQISCSTSTRSSTQLPSADGLIDTASIARAQKLEPLDSQEEAAAHPLHEPSSEAFCSEGWEDRMEVDEGVETFEAGEDLVVVPSHMLLVPSYLKRVCSTVGTVDGSPLIALLLATHAALLECGLMPDWPEDPAFGPYALPTGWQLQPGCFLEYRLSPELTEEPVRCTVRALPVGDHLVVWGIVSSSHPPISVTLGSHFVDAGGASCGFASVKELWIKVKDGLALPLLVAMHAAAGLPPPFGLLQLPMELKEKILDLLSDKVNVLRTLAEVCTELRHLSSDDRLWRPLVEEEFGSAEACPEGTSMKAYFQKRARARAAARTQVQSRRMGFPYFPTPALPFLGGDLIAPPFLRGRFPSGSGLPGIRPSIPLPHMRARRDPSVHYHFA